MGLALAAAISISGCRLPRNIYQLFGGQIRFDVRVDEKLNRDSALAVDVVVVYSKGLLKELKTFSAGKWIQQREQFIKDHPRDVEHHPWEWVPGKAVERRFVPYRLGAKGAFVFAHYETAGDHRELIAPLDDFVLDLGEKGFEILPFKGWLDDLAGELEEVD